MSSKRVALLLAALLCMLAVVPSALFAQTAGTGQVAGTVTDPSGGAIVGATVTLTDSSTSTTRTGVTNDTGRYILVDIRSGSYNMTVSKTGFRISKLTDQQVSVGNTLTLNVTLEIGSVAETVEVTVTPGAELQTMNATIGNTISGVTLASLPAIGGDVSTFVALQPGVGPDGSVAGAVVDQSTFMLDGGQNTNDMDGSMQVYTPSFGGDPTGGIAAGNGLRGGGSSGGVPTGVMPTPSDSVEEFKVATTGQTADFNTSAGAQVQVVTKRGTNAFHGTLYEYYLDNNFNANTWQNNGQTDASGAWDPTKLPSFHYNRFGGAVGGPVTNKEFLGGKTYFFVNYQGFRWNNTVTISRPVPSESMRLGILRFSNDPTLTCNAKNIGNCTAYNLNPYPVVDPVTGLTLAATTLDPRLIGINPSVVSLWNLMPAGNDVGCGNGIAGSRCDTVNEIGFAGNMLVPQDDNFWVARVDHDFGSKWHLTASYRYYKLTRATSSQVNISSGEPVSTSARPQQPWYFVAGLTTNVTTNTTNDLHYSYLRNFWSWGNAGGGPQLPGFGGALEPLGESSSALTPYNVDTQDVRTRFWDGHDNFLRDDWTMLKGNHLFTWGGAYQRNWDWHQRTDNGGGINYTATYLLGDSSGAGAVQGIPAAPAGASGTTWRRDYAAVLGIVTDAQIAYTRTGPTLALNPPLTPAFDKSTIPYYNVYFGDSWRVKPTFTFTYGLGWTLEMPPTEAEGKQIELLDDAGQQLNVEAYLNQRKNAALGGAVYNPTVGFSLVGNTGAGQKYPYNPYYGSFSPRIAAAWSPNYDDGFLGKLIGRGKTVVRGGFSIVYGRLNGVDQVLVPLLGTGLIQPVTCTAAIRDGSCGGTVTALNAFRAGVDGLIAPIPAATPTLPQPVFPGINNVSAAAGEALDPNFRPNVVKGFDLTVQRQITPKVLVELGYIGRKITHEYQPININAVPYMMTMGGQQFAKAYAGVETQLGCLQGQNVCGAAIPVKAAGESNAAYAAALTAYANTFTPQPFFEAALAGTGYCAGFSSCTAATVFNENGNYASQSVWSLWSDLDQGGIGGGGGGTTNPGFNFARSMLNTSIPDNPNGGSGQFTSGVAVNASVGYGNYNAGFVSLKVNNWHGLTVQQNFTMSKALGTGAFVQASSEYTPNDPWDLNNMYGAQGFDRKFVYNILAVYELPFYKNQQGILGHVLGGWNVSPIFTAGSGLPLYCNTATDAQAFGSGDGNNFFDNEQCLPVTPVNTGSATAHNNGGSPNIFTNASADYANWRAPILGYDGRDGGVGFARGLPYWNLDMSLRKNIRITERVSMEFQFLCLNTLNHMQFSDPSMSLGNQGQWGVLTTQGNTPRQMEFGLRLKF